MTVEPVEGMLASAAGMVTAAMRWVAQPGAKIPRTRHGLLDSDALSRDWYSGDRPMRADALVGADRSYVLLASGGAGKSTLLQELKSREQDSASVDLRMHVSDPLTPLMRAVDAGARFVFIDALDEALQLNPNIGYVLTLFLSGTGARDAAWRLACRPGSWTLDLAEGISAALTDFDELDLLPLDQPGIAHIAGPDAAAYMAAVDQARLTRQLAQPLHARALLEHWRRTGALPATRSEAMRHTVERLLEEGGDFRPARRQGDPRMALIAERLATITLVGGVGRFALGRKAPVPRTHTSDDGSDAAADAPDRTATITVTAVPIDRHRRADPAAYDGRRGRPVARLGDGLGDHGPGEQVALAGQAQSPSVGWSRADSFWASAWSSRRPRPRPAPGGPRRPAPTPARSSLTAAPAPCRPVAHREWTGRRAVGAAAAAASPGRRAAPGAATVTAGSYRTVAPAVTRRETRSTPRRTRRAGSNPPTSSSATHDARPGPWSARRARGCPGRTVASAGPRPSSERVGLVAPEGACRPSGR